VFPLSGSKHSSGTPQSFYNHTIDILFRTYPFYIDRASRHAVQQCLKADGFYPPHTSKLLAAYQDETSKEGLAPSNAFVLVEWGSVFLQHSTGKDGAFANYGDKIMLSLSRGLERCLSRNAGARPSVKKSALVVTRRALRKLICAEGEVAITSILEQLAAKGQPYGIKNAVLLGTLAGVCARIPEAKLVLESKKQLYYSFYVREVLGSRAHVPNHLAAALNDFFECFTTLDDLRKEVVPALEKSLLRAPEIVLNDLMSPLVASLPNELDLANILADHLLRPLLTSVKSQNEVVRSGALSAFQAFIGQSYEQKALGKITDELLDQLSRSKSPAEHQYFARMIAMLSPVDTKAMSMCDALPKILAKEPNEAAIASEVTALLNNLHKASSESRSISTQSISNAAIKGLNDKRAGTRRVWLLGIGSLLWADPGSESSQNTVIQSMVVEILPTLLAILEQVIKNPLAAIQSGTALGGFVMTALWQILSTSPAQKIVCKSRTPMDQAFSTGTNPSFLLSYRVYTKIAYQDLPWVARALDVCVDGKFDKRQMEARIPWAEAFIYIIAAADVPPSVRKEAAASLTKVYVRRQSVVADTIVHGLWKWYSDVKHEKKDTPALAARTGTSHASLVLRSICPPPTDVSKQGSSDTASAKDQLVNMLVLCRPELIPGAQWIDLCLRMGQDPGFLVASRAEECLANVETALTVGNDSSTFTVVQEAACKTAAELAFVCPGIVTPMLVAKVKAGLPVEEVELYGPTEMAIARTPEGTAFVDVLSTQGQKYTMDKNSRDYETAKWEAEIRSQIAQKKGQEKKLTADENAKVDGQLSKEAIIRQNVQRLERKLRVSAGYIYALATGPPTEASLWLGPALKALFEAISTGAGRIAGPSLDEAYLACANYVAPRLSSQRRFIGIATLRAVGSSTISPDLQQEPLRGGLPFITRRLKLTR